MIFQDDIVKVWLNGDGIVEVETPFTSVRVPVQGVAAIRRATTRICQRCSDALKDDVAGFSADGRLICTRSGCQFVERLNERVAKGEVKIVPLESLAQVKTDDKPVFYSAHLDGVLTRPIPSEQEVDDRAGPIEAHSILLHSVGRTVPPCGVGPLDLARPEEKLKEIHRLHAESCEDSECLLCGVLSCPVGEPMHFHHDGCPACPAPASDEEIRSCRDCKHSGMDMDMDPYCGAQKVREAHPHGLVLHSPKIATFCPAPEKPLFEAREKVMPS